MDQRQKIITIVTTLVSILVLDQLTKVWAVEKLKGEPLQSFLWDTFRLGYAENTGVFLGLGNQLPQSVRFTLFIGLVSIALVATLIYVMRSKRLSGLQVAMLAMIVSGGVGNLIDRIRNEGVVVDFLNVGIGSLRTGVFNIADMAVTGGVLALLFTSFSQPKTEVEAETSGDDPSDVPDDQIPS